MNKRNLIALILSLCLFMHAMPALALDSSGEDFPETEAESQVQGLYDFFQPAVVEAPIVPFMNLSWSDLQLYGKEAAAMVDTERITKGSNKIPYRIEFRNLEENSVTGCIFVENDDEAMLRGVWNQLGREMMAMSTSVQPVEVTHEASQAAIQFINSETYIRYEYLDGGDYRYILFVLVSMMME